MVQSIFERVGGFAAVRKIVMDFYDRVLDSEKAGDFFEDIELPNLIDHQAKFIASLLGGPASFSDEHLRVVHARLKIDAASFDEMKDILAETLADHGLPPTDVTAVIDSIEERRAMIVST